MWGDEKGYLMLVGQVPLLFQSIFSTFIIEIVGFLCLRASFTFFGASTEIVKVLLFLSLPCAFLTMTELYQIISGTFNTYVPDSSLELLR